MPEQNFNIGDYLIVKTYAKYIGYEELDSDCCPYVISLASPLVPDRISFLADFQTAAKLSAEDIPVEIRKSLDYYEQERRKRMEEYRKEEERVALKAFGIEGDDGETPERSGPEERWEYDIDEEIF